MNEIDQIPGALNPVEPLISLQKQECNDKVIKLVLTGVSGINFDQFKTLSNSLFSTLFQKEKYLLLKFGKDLKENSNFYPDQVPVIDQKSKILANNRKKGNLIQYFEEKNNVIE